MAGLTKEEQKRRAELLAKGLKVCGKCGRVLPVEQFSKRTASKDGLQSKCKECDNISTKQYNEEHKEEIQQYQNQYYQENKEKLQQYQNQYNQENKEQVLQYQQQYRQEHKKEKQQYDKQHQPQYYQTPQGQVVQFNYSTKRRQRKEEQGAGITKEQWLEMMNFFDFKCAYSDKSISSKNNRSIDHIVPLVKGGAHEVWNCVPMDRSLNSSKQDKDIMEWYTAQEFYSKERLDKILAWQQYAYNKWSVK